MLTNVYGKPVKPGAEIIIVSTKEAKRLQERAKSLSLKCTCLACNPVKEARLNGD